MNFHLFADEVERRKVAPLAWSGLARFLKACCCSAFPKSITPVNAVVSFCLIRVLYELTSGMHSCYNVHLNEAGRDTKSEQFPRMGPVSIMNAVILLFGADGALFREKNDLCIFWCIIRFLLKIGGIIEVSHIFDLFLKSLSADS